MRSKWIRGAEIVLLLPATILFVPLAGFTALGILFAIVQDIRFGPAAELTLVLKMFLFLVPIAGITSLWVATMGSAELLANRKLRILTLIGILAGLADATFWLYTVTQQSGIHETTSVLSTWLLWLLMLAGPILTGIRQVSRLLRRL
jgi:hypothetical protein